MTQGNPFGNKGGDWMPEAALRALLAADVPYDQIAEANYVLTGWRPSRSGLTRKREALNMPARNAAHGDLIPWRIAPAHSGDLMRHWLQAESRKRQGIPVSATDAKLLKGLHEELNAGPRPKVITYHPGAGFALALREDTDTDIIRWPADPALLRKDLRAGNHLRDRPSPRGAG